MHATWKQVSSPAALTLLRPPPSVIQIGYGSIALRNDSRNSSSKFSYCCVKVGATEAGCFRDSGISAGFGQATSSGVVAQPVSKAVISNNEAFTFGIGFFLAFGVFGVDSGGFTLRGFPFGFYVSLKCREFGLA